MKCVADSKSLFQTATEINKTVIVYRWQACSKDDKFINVVLHVLILTSRVLMTGNSKAMVALLRQWTCMRKVAINALLGGATNRKI